MNLHHHQETHTRSSEAIRDFVIGMSDGLTVPFALAAGLTSALQTTNLIVTAGAAEIAAGAIAMGLGGYLSAKTQLDHYDSEHRRETREIEMVPHLEEREVAEILQGFGVAEEHVSVVTHAIKQNPQKWVDFMMRFELGLERPDTSRLFLSPLVIGGAYILGGLIPLSPYIFGGDIHAALRTSIALTLISLGVFGAFKGHFTGVPKARSAIQTMLIGGTAAAAAFAIGRAFA